MTPPDSADIQMILRGLALQVIQCPGWEDASRRIAQKLGGDDAEIMFIEFWEILEEEECLNGNLG